MRIYVAAPSEEIVTARHIRNTLELEGHVVTSRWLTDHNFGNERSAQPDEEICRRGAQDDLDDVDSADIVLIYNTEKYRHSGTGGRHVEVGFALARNKPVLLYGDRTNVFHYHRNVVHLEDPGDYIKAVERIKNSMQRGFWG